MIGPKKFLLRLKPFIDEYDFIVVNPDKSGCRILMHYILTGRRNKVILRCDGLNFVKLSRENITALCQVKGWKFEKYLIVFVSFLGISKASYIFNIWLNRYSIISYYFAGKIVFQSALSKDMFRIFNPLYSKNKDSKIIFNGISANKRVVSSIDPKIFNICISANPFRPHKRLLDAIQIVQKLVLLESTIQIRLFVFGPVSEKDIICNLDFVNHYVNLEESDYLDQMSKCHVLLSLALFDPCPNVVVEALSLGLPVLTPCQSGAFELINKFDDWAVDEGHVLEISDFQSDKFIRISSENVDRYVKKLQYIIHNFTEQREIALIYSKRLEIDLIANEYITYARN